MDERKITFTSQLHNFFRNKMCKNQEKLCEYFLMGVKILLYYWYWLRNDKTWANAENIFACAAIAHVSPMEAAIMRHDFDQIRKNPHGK